MRVPPTQKAVITERLMEWQIGETHMNRSSWLQRAQTAVLYTWVISARVESSTPFARLVVPLVKRIMPVSSSPVSANSSSSLPPRLNSS